MASNQNNNAITTTYPSLRTAKDLEHELRARVLELQTQLEQVQKEFHASQQPDASKPREARSNANDTHNPHDANLTITALRQQLYVSEQRTLHFRQQADQHVYELEHLVRTAWDRCHTLEGNLNYLIGELEKANGYNAALNEHVVRLRKEAELREREIQRRDAAALALHSNKAKESPSSSAGCARNGNNKVAPIVPPGKDTRTLLAHNQATIRTLCADIRALKAAKNLLEDRVLALGPAPAPDDMELFTRCAGLPREVLQEWSAVLLGRDREVASMAVKLERERERELRAAMQGQKCSKCEPVVVEDDEGTVTV